MKRINWPRTTDVAVAVPGPTHPNAVRVAAQIRDHARAGRTALLGGRLIEAKYHRDCCSLLLWRLSVDGLTADGQLRMDGAKYEPFLPGRLSTEEARRMRGSPELGRRARWSITSRATTSCLATASPRR